MFNKFINQAVYHTAFATSYACFQTAKQLRVVANKLDVAAKNTHAIAVKHGTEAGIINTNNIIPLSK